MPGGHATSVPAVVLGLVLAAGFTTTGCNTLPDNPETALLKARCGRCHRYDNALIKRKTPLGWKRTVWAMRQRGAELTDEEADFLVRYLSENRALP